MKIRRLWLVAALALVTGCAGEDPSSDPSAALMDLLPDAASGNGWRIAEGPDLFGPDTLWEYLDGGAPRYEAYGFEQLLHVRYQLGDDPLTSVTADVYDMGTDLGAFGIYRSIRPAEALARTWGCEGYLSGNVAAAWKGSVFVHVAADDERPELIERVELLVSQICESVVGSVSPPAILQVLPPKNLVPHSERYVASDLLGHAALPGGVLATYEIDGHTGDLFFSELADDTGAQQALEAFRREKERWADVSGVTDGFRFEDPGIGSGTVVRSGRFVIGVQGDLPVADQEALLARLADRLEN